MVDFSSDHKKPMGEIKNALVTKNHAEHKNVLSNQKDWEHSMNRTQIKNHKIETYEVNGHDELSLGC